MPTPEARKMRYWTFVIALIALVISLSANVTSFLVNYYRVEQNQEAICSVKNATDGVIFTERNLRQNQGKNTAKYIKAQTKFITDTTKLTSLFNKAPNRKQLDSIVAYLADQVNLQKVQRSTSQNNLTLSTKATERLRKIRSSLSC